VHGSRQDGFSLIEMVVVLAIVAVLTAIAIPAFSGYRTRAQDSDAQADLRTTLLIEGVHHLENSEFTETTSVLEAAEPAIRFNVAGDPAGSVRVKTGLSGADREVCMFALSESGRWFAVYHTSDDGTRFGQSAPADCQDSLASGWSTTSW
jgi:type IV pilus assembly protein PilA